MPDDALIHLRVPASLKARWVRESRAAGMRLTDWILQRMELAMQQKTTTAVIPDGQDVAVFRDGPEDNLASLLSSWYHAHRSAGGEPDVVYEDLIAEVRAEDAAGQHYSHAPGRA